MPYIGVGMLLFNYHIYGLYANNSGSFGSQSMPFADFITSYSHPSVTSIPEA